MRLRTVWIGMAVVVALVAAALAVFVATFDANRYKPTIVSLVEQYSGRKLDIQGDLSLSIVPDIALSMGKATLSGPKGEGRFASIESAEIGVALWPLLSRQIQVRRIALDALRVDVVRHRDGSTNFDDLVARLKAQRPQAGAPETNASPGADVASAAATTITVAELALRGAALAWRDEASGDEWHLQALDLTADRIGSGEPGRLKASGRLRGKKAGVDAQLDAACDYRADFATGRIDLSEAKLDATTEDGVSARLDAPALTIDGGSVHGRPLALQLQMQRDATKLEASLSAQVQAPAKQPIALRDIRANLAASGGQLSADGVKASLGGNGTIDLQRKTASLELQGRFADSPMQARFTAPSLSPLALQFDVQADALDVDRLRAMAPAPAKKGAGRAPAGTGVAVDAGAPSPTTAAKPGGEIPVPPIAGIDTTGSLRIGSLRAAGIDLRNLAMTLRSGDGRVDVTRLAAALYGGTLAGNASLATSGRAALKMQLNDVDVGRVLREFAQREILDGSGSVAIDVSGTGKTVPALERSLAGSARIALRDGAVLGIDLDKVLRKVESTIAAVRGSPALESRAGGGERTAFSSLDASFVIREGVARSDDLDLRSPLLRVGGKGSIDLPEQTIDYLLRVSLVDTLAGQGGAARTALRGVTIPVRVSGPMASLSYRVEVDSLAREALKNEAKKQLEQRLFGKGSGNGSGNGEKSGDTKKPNPRDLLRGLIGR
ncbi:MAG: AsmA family protein [Burkholderiaceae bacterium]|nr:AsmA family protein [Burkholderiaceae bacterium]